MKKNYFIIFITCTLILFLTGCQLGGVKKGSAEVMEQTNIEDFSTWSLYSEDYLKELRETYQLDEKIKDCKSDFEKVEVITKWVSGLWSHDGANQPEQSDPLFILDQVINYNQKYRCVEYGVVIDGCLQALSLDSRELSLKMENVETIEVGAGHVGCEVYLNDLQKWVFIDGQWGAIPMMGDTPLNAYEFGQAIQTESRDLHINWVNNIYSSTDDNYYKWIKPYIFYLDAAYIGSDGEEKEIMFVPKGGKEVTIFQIKYPINMDHYTRNILEFYQGQAQIKQ